MNIMFLNSIDKDVFGGVESWTTQLAGTLCERGHRVTVVSRRGSELLRRAAITSSEINCVSIPIAGDFNPRTIIRLKSLMSSLKTDVLFTSRNKDLRLGGLAARWQGRARVIWRLGVNLTRNNFVHRWLTPRLIDSVMVPSESLKQEVIRCGYIDDSLIHIIPNGLADRAHDLKPDHARSQLREKYNIAKDSLIAVTVSRLVKGKGLLVLIAAAERIVRAHPNVRFLLVGDGPERPELEKAVSRIGLEQVFVLTGALDDYELELAGSDLMIHPSMAESFGNVLLDAMRHSLPVIASRVGGIPEVIAEPETAVLVTPGDPFELASAAATLIDNPDLRHKMGQAGRERFLDFFTLEKMTNRVENHLISLTDKGA